MVGIDVGATKIIRSNGSSFPLPPHVLSRHLLLRVAADLPIVQIYGTRCNLATAHGTYAAAVAAALQEQQLGDLQDPPIALAVPGWWSPQTLTRVGTALAAEGVHAHLVNDAEAAVTEVQHQGHSLPDNVAVVSLRASHSSVVIVKNCTQQPTAMLSPCDVIGEGGDDLDAAVLRHVVAGLTHLGDDIPVRDSQTIASAQEVLRQCRGLREALSTSATESMLPQLPRAGHRIRMVRSELEELAEPWIDSVLEMVTRTIEASSTSVDMVLLTGGVAAMPLVSQRLSADLALEVLVPEDPTFVTVRGAERLFASRTKPAARNRSLWHLVKQVGPRRKHEVGTDTTATHEPPLPSKLQAAEHIMSPGIDSPTVSSADDVLDERDAQPKVRAESLVKP